MGLLGELVRSWPRSMARFRRVRCRSVTKFSADAIDAADVANLQPVGRPKKTSQQNDECNVFVRGNSSIYAMRKLRADRPDIHARVLAGTRSSLGSMAVTEDRSKRRPIKVVMQL